jgi:hypothetical protein
MNLWLVFGDGASGKYISNQGPTALPVARYGAILGWYCD